MVGQRGTALLMTMILITVIGSVAFGVGRTTLSNMRQVNRLEDSLNAYQAAQAGIEDALLRFRFDKNAEAPMSASCNTVSPNYTVPTVSSKIFSRVNISNPVSKDCVDLSGPVPAPSSPDDIVYDLKMFYKKDINQHECITIAEVLPQDPPGCIRTSQSAALNQDTAIEYDVRNIPNLSLKAKFSSPNLSNAIEVISIGTTAVNGVPVDQILGQSLLRPNGDTVDSNPSTFSPEAERIRLRAFGSSLAMYDLSAPGKTLDSRITIVESIGYFGVSKRKLTLTLDRLTGTVSEVFDFVLFSGNGPIIGPGN